MRALEASQKTSKGAPAYSRFLNRPLGRVLAAAAHVAGLTPNQVTAISAAFTFTAIALIALVEATPVTAAIIVFLLAVGYAFDAADGQLARLRGGGSAAGEWLDHTVDVVKEATIHIAVLVNWARFEDYSDSRMLIPVSFGAAVTVLFFCTTLTDQIRRASRGQTRMIMKGEGSSSILYSLAVAPVDYGILIVSFALFWWAQGYFAVYTTLFVLTVAFLALALPKWFRELTSLSESQ